MSPSASWEPFEVTEDEYWEILQLWDQMEIANEIQDDHFRYDPKMFIQDFEIMNIPNHGRYLSKSREKYESFYFG